MERDMDSTSVILRYLRWSEIAVLHMSCSVWRDYISELKDPPAYTLIRETCEQIQLHVVT